MRIPAWPGHGTSALGPLAWSPCQRCCCQEGELLLCSGGLPGLHLGWGEPLLCSEGPPGLHLGGGEPLLCSEGPPGLHLGGGEPLLCSEGFLGLQVVVVAVVVAVPACASAAEGPLTLFAPPSTHPLSPLQQSMGLPLRRRQQQQQQQKCVLRLQQQ